MNCLTEGTNKIFPNLESESIKKLEEQFTQLYNQALILSKEPESDDYQAVKAELKINLKIREDILRG